jgi:hypothetical protein
MKNESLVGGLAKGRRWFFRPYRQKTSTNQSVPQIGYRFLLVLIIPGVLFAFMGVLKIKLEFEVRDYQIESRRLQRLASQREDRAHAFETHLSQLQQGDILKTAATSYFGMNEPEPGKTKTLGVSETVRSRWQNAAEKVREEKRNQSVKEEN